MFSIYIHNQWYNGKIVVIITEKKDEGWWLGMRYDVPDEKALMRLGLDIDQERNYSPTYPIIQTYP